MKQIVESLLQAGADPSDVYELLDKKMLRQLNKARSSTVDMLICPMISSPHKESLSLQSSSTNDEDWADNEIVVKMF